MNQSVAAAHHPLASASSFGKLPLFLFGGVVVAALAYIGVALTDDLAATRETSWVPFVLLGIALLIALGFEFVNGFHDTANAVATVIYTHSLTPNTAVVWSGLCNFCGVHLGGTAVAFSIVHLMTDDLLISIGQAKAKVIAVAILVAAI